MEGSHYVFKNAAEFLAKTGPQCDFCNFKEISTQHHLQVKHLNKAVYYCQDNTEKFVVACFCKDKDDPFRSHYHCPECDYKAFTRTDIFRKHLMGKHGISAAKKGITLKRTCEDDPEYGGQKKEKIQCQYCTAYFKTPKNVKRHVAEVHGIVLEPMICIDIINGIYATPKNKHSPMFPIHVLKSTQPARIDCEVEECRMFMQIALSSGNPGKECIHLERTKHACPFVKPAPLRNESLDSMLEKGLISHDWSKRCSDLKNAADGCDVDSVHPIVFNKEQENRWHYFSVFTNETDNWCQFQRCRVMFDTFAGKWTCQCGGTGHSYWCVHRLMAMWWIYQEAPQMLKDPSDMDNTEEIDDMENYLIESNNMSDLPSNPNIEIMTEYLLTQKRIPCPDKLTRKLRSKEEKPPGTFIPQEETCPYCPGPTKPSLTSHKIICTDAIVYGIEYVHKDVSVAIRECPVCFNYVRFQEYSFGFHNFNNRVFLTIPLCQMLLAGLANKTTPGRMLDTITGYNDNKYHHQTVRSGFHHFLSMTDFEYTFSCVRCGHDPPVVIGDANWKLAFDIPVGTFKRPSADRIQDNDLEINIEKAWSDLDKCLIAEGLLSGSTKNPYSPSAQCTSILAPWMGRGTRVGDVLPKTEHLKALKKRQDNVKVPEVSINEDSILDLLASKKPAKNSLKDACLALGVSSEGSITDLLNRLEELLNFKDVYPKVFIKLQKAGGGILHFSCPHGVVYYVNFLFWKESARDHTDGLLSFKHFPTCYISDIACQVAKHTNNRTEQRFFQPHDGRLCAATNENIEHAKNKMLTMNMDWVKHLRYPSQIYENQNLERVATAHPVTKTSDRYSLYDRFHQKNQKRPEEILRSLNVCPALRTEINSSVAEQLNRQLSSVKYSLCKMNEGHFKQIVRVLIDCHNSNINQKFRTQIESTCNVALTVGLHGTLGLEGGPSASVKVQQSTLSSSNSPLNSSFNEQEYAITDSDMDTLRNCVATPRDQKDIVAILNPRIFLEYRDMCSLCPPELLTEVSHKMPWLTDDAVNYRVAQLAKQYKCGSLATYDYILWHRQWTKKGAVSYSASKNIPVSDLVLLPRIVGHASPETGNHFILWAFDFIEQKIRVYDSLSMHEQIHRKDMDILRNAFRLAGGLRDWEVEYPPQWKQQDSMNCGVFVCSAAENEVMRRRVSSEPLTIIQCRILRLHHGSEMLKCDNSKDISSRMEPTKDGED